MLLMEGPAGYLPIIILPFVVTKLSFVLHRKEANSEGYFFHFFLIYDEHSDANSHILTTLREVFVRTCMND
jgi:hypothetical protein